MVVSSSPATCPDRSLDGQGRLFDGPPLDPATMRRLLCDSGIHRHGADAPGPVLDRGGG